MSNELDVTTNNKAVESIATLRSGAGVFSTISGDDMASKVKTLNAMTAAEPISEHLNKPIKLANFVCQAVEINDEKTGESLDAVRVILIDDQGKSYAAISDGIMGSLRDLVSILGEPSVWESPLPVKVIEQKSRKGFRFFSLTIG